MTINERVRHLRKNILEKSQAEFANDLGMAQTGVSYMERNPSAVTEQNIKAICLIYNICENWLRYGIEPVFTQPDTFSLDRFVKEKGATYLELEIVKAYFELEPSIRRAAMYHFKNRLSAALSTDSNTESSSEDLIPNTAKEFEKQNPPIADDVG